MAILYRMLFYIAGLIFITFGVSLTIIADLGTGAWDALNVGLYNTIGLTVGSWVFIVGILLIFVNSFLLRSRPDYLAIVAVMVVGLLIDFWLLVALENIILQDLPTRFGVLLAGLVLIGLGAAVYLPVKFPLIPIDNFMLAIKARLKVNLVTAKTIGEVIALMFAFLFNGPIGLGTLVITFGIGPFIQLFSPYFEKMLYRLTAKD
ncbi:YczE/YyaS/YitT family protein [Mesobacillus harenae]|uniref:YczE/YyaS/YitT family protein n=1 Tax=Mesobacillus harenae TaxID=2213203 RepID=UPI001580BEF9|nr:membrane protein [Mesobacillus harenae]